MEVFVSSAGSAYAARKERLNRHARIGMTNREPDGAVGFSANDKHERVNFEATCEVFMKRLLCIFLYAAIVAILPLSQFAEQDPPTPSGSIAIQHVNVINVQSGARSADQTVVVTGNKITQVGRSALLSRRTEAAMRRE